MLNIFELLSTDKNKRVLHYFLFLAIAFVLSFYFTALRYLFCREFPGITFVSLLDNSADLPFQYRVLVPWLAGLLQKTGLPFLNSPVRLFQVFELFSTFFLFVAFRSYLSLFMKESEFIKSLFSLSIFYVLPFNFILYSPPYSAPLYPWDIPSVLFITLGLILLYKKNWVVYYPLFIAATLNRETAIFLTFIYFVNAVKKDRPTTILLHCLAQIVIWALIKLGLAGLFVNNPGAGLFMNFFWRNLPMLANPQKLGVLASSFGFIWVAVVLYFRSIPDGFVKRSLLVIFPFFSGMLIAGNLTELRIYGELIPIVLPAFLLVAASLVRNGWKKV